MYTFLINCSYSPTHFPHAQIICNSSTKVKLFLFFFAAMTAHAGTSRLLALAVVFLSLLTAPPLLEAVQCPRDSVSVNNGSLMFRPLSPGTANTDPNYDPGAIGGWYSLASGFVDVVRSGNLPYSELHEVYLLLPVPNLRGNHSSHCLFS